MYSSSAGVHYLPCLTSIDDEQVGRESSANAEHNTRIHLSGLCSTCGNNDKNHGSDSSDKQKRLDFNLLCTPSSVARLLLQLMRSFPQHAK